MFVRLAGDLKLVQLNETEYRGRQSRRGGILRCHFCRIFKQQQQTKSLLTDCFRDSYRPRMTFTLDDEGERYP